MKTKIFSLIALLLVAVMALASCGIVKGAVDFVIDIFGSEVELPDAPLGGEKIVDFAVGPDYNVLFESDGWTNGDVFNVVWKKNNVKFEDGLMKLGITEEKVTAWLDNTEVEYNYTAGEARTQNYYHYGDFEVCMKPSANPGTASTFFTCTGPYDTKFVLDENGDYVLDENGQRVSVQNPHDEIDIEFLGKDTTHVQFNFFVDGKGGNEYMHELGFDASQDFHTYGYRWEPNAITWFVDGVAVYKVTTDTTVQPAKNVKIVEKIPQTPGRILTNYWCGTQRAEGWMGKYKGSEKDQGTEYKWISTSAQGAPLNPVEKPPVVDEGLDWAKIDAIAPTFESTELYTVVNEGNVSDVTYTAVGGSDYKNVEMDITEASSGKNYLHLVVENKGENPVRFRVNVIDMALVEAGAQNMSTNLSATVNGEAAFTDLEWGGSFFDLAPGQSYEIVIAFNGVVEKLQLMPDSSKNDSSVNAGHIAVSDIKFATVGEVEIPHSCTDADGDNVCDECGEGMIVPPSPSEHPVSGNLTLNFGSFTTNIGGNVTDGYGVSVDENNNIQVEYTNIVGNSYKNIWADLSAIAGTKNIFTVKVTNTGEAAMKFRIDIESRTQVNANTTCCNLSATKNGEGVFTDLEWGGSIFEIGVGETAVLEVVYDASKLPTNVKMMIDSCQWDDSTSHAGSLFITDLAFGGEYIPVTYTVTGSSSLCGANWDYNDASNDMTLGADGLYTKTYENVSVYVHEFKVIKDRSWGTGHEFPTTNFKFYVNQAGSKVVVKLDPKTGEVSCDVYAPGSTTPEDHSNFYMVVGASGLCGDILNTEAEGWGWELENAANVLLPVADGKYQLTYKGIAAGTYGIKVVKNASWDEQWGDNGNDYNIVVTEDNSNVTVTFDPATGLITYVAEQPGEEPPVVTPPVDEPKVEYTDLYVEYKTENAYTLTSPDTYANQVRVTYTDIAQNSWANINIWVDDKSADCSLFAMKITNHGTENVSVWVQMKDAAGAELINQNLIIAPGSEDAFELIYTGKAQMIFFFVDSTHEATAAVNAGDITISELKLGKVKGETNPDNPPAGEPVEGEYLSFKANDCYTLSATEADYVNSINVTYTAVSDNTYQNVNTWIQDKAAGKGTLGITIKNNGTETVNITVKLENASGEAAETKVTLAAGESVSAFLDYPAFAPDQLFLFIDSGWSTETATHAGDITISGIHFK